MSNRVHSQRPHHPRPSNHSNRTPHHLSSSVEPGWVEGIANLTEEHEATKLVVGDAYPGTEGRKHLNGDEEGSSMDSLNGNAREGEDDEDLLEQRFVSSLQEEVVRVGEVVSEIGTSDGQGPTGLSESDLEMLLLKIRTALEDIDADISVLRRRRVPAATPGSPEMFAADICARRRSASQQAPVEVRVAIVGNVDSGKSTSVGVLTRSVLDDGRGSARARVFKHGHEESTGRTSSIGQHNLCLDSTGNVLNDPQFKTSTIADYVARAAKVVTLVDLAGHEKYFKTTAYGLTGHLPDYACLIVGGNAGIVGMCKEHLGVALALRVPVFFIITKVDLAPAHVLQHTLTTLQTILKKPGVKKRPFVVRSTDDVITCAKHVRSGALAPIFLTSSVTGQGLDLVRMFYNLLPQRIDWSQRASDPMEFVIDETFGVPGVGTVVAGTVKRGVIRPSTTFLLGPDIGDGKFKPCQVKSIHYKRLPVSQVVAGQTAALALKKVRRGQVRKGMVLVSEDVLPRAVWEFDADIAILTHSTTIQPKYQAVIHCEIVRQSARVVAMDRDLLRSGDRSLVRFRFMQHPEYLTIGTRFVFREGRTKGIGVVAGLVDPEDEINPHGLR